MQVSGYFFQNTLNPQRVGSAALTASNPSGNNRFVTDTVFGQARTVYDVTGSANPRSAQGGTHIPGEGQGSSQQLFDGIRLCVSAGSTGWRRIYGCVNLTRSEGLYLDPSGYLAYYSGVSANTAIGKLAAGTYYHVIMVKKPGEVLLYVNGVLVASRSDGTPLGEMDAVANPEQLVQLFLDDDVFEWAPARIALFRVYSGALTATEVKTIYASPFTSTVGLAAPGFQSCGIVNSASYCAGQRDHTGRILHHLRYGSGRRFRRLGAVVCEQRRSAALEQCAGAGERP